MGSASEKDLARPASHLGTVIPAKDDDDYDDVSIFHKGIVPTNNSITEILHYYPK